jgi:hypothetical protein
LEYLIDAGGEIFWWRAFLPGMRSLDLELAHAAPRYLQAVLGTNRLSTI